MNYNIYPYEGIGALKIKMSVDDVRNTLGTDFSSFRKTEDSEMQTDSYENLGLHIYYKKNGLCEAIEIFKPANPIFMGETLFKKSFFNLRKWFKEIDDDLELEDTGLTSYKYGIGLYAPYAGGNPVEPIESVIIFEKGYYD